MKFKDYYQILGVERDASQDEIKRSYRRLARKFHPDVSEESDAEERFKEVQEAYEVLKDPEKRSAFDRFGAHWKAGQDFEAPPGWHADFGLGGGGFTDGSRFSDFFESLFGRGADARSRGGSAHFRMSGEDSYARVLISVEDAYHGTTRTITLDTPESNDRGEVVTQRKALKVKIPKGVTEGQRIRLAGKGAPGYGGAPNGDLFLQVAFEPHPLYRPVGRNLYLDLPVAPWEAALGRTVPVPTLGGKVDVKIPPGSQTGQTLRLKGRGLPGDPPGDQFVVLEVVVPKATNSDARDLYERMERELQFNPREALGV